LQCLSVDRGEPPSTRQQRFTRTGRIIACPDIPLVYLPLCFNAEQLAVPLDQDRRLFCSECVEDALQLLNKFVEADASECRTHHAHRLPQVSFLSPSLRRRERRTARTPEGILRIVTGGPGGRMRGGPVEREEGGSAWTGCGYGWR